MAEAPQEASGKIIDLMEALKASLAAQPKQEASSEPPKEAKKKGRKAS
jgi:non-homologous end joining protein Ku